MSQVCLIDSDRLSALLLDALPWSEHVASLMVSALNGSVLACAYRDGPPSIKAMRTQSTTMTAAYTVASEDVLVFEAQNTGAVSVITRVADHVLLAVTGPEPAATTKTAAAPNGMSSGDDDRTSGTASENDVEGDPADGDDSDHRQIRADLEVVSDELGRMLKDELATMKWPDDI